MHAWVACLACFGYCRKVTEEEEQRYRAARGGDEGENAGPAHGTAAAFLAATAL
jgi:hypothetical protein